MSVLDEILKEKRREVRALRDPEIRAALAADALAAPSPADFRGALRRADGRLAVIGEFKRRSPSKGVLLAEGDPALIAKSYLEGGASAMSVLTDEKWFGGSPEDLVIARATSALPVLRKDFIIHPVQVTQSRAMGADAVLLIEIAVPDDKIFVGILERAEKLGMAVLVEIEDRAGLKRALDAGAQIIGVNNRDLRTFEEDRSTAQRLIGRIPADVIAVSESGIRDTVDASRMATSGFDAVLVGEALVRSTDPVGVVRSMAAHKVGPRQNV